MPTKDIAYMFSRKVSNTKRARFVVFVLVLLNIFITPSMTLAQSSQVDLHLIIESSETNSNSQSRTLTAILSNKSTANIENIDFSLASQIVLSGIIQALPSTLSPGSTAVGHYEIVVDGDSTINIAGVLSYAVGGKQKSLVSFASIDAVRDSSVTRDVLLIAIGALISLFAGIATELTKGLLDKRRNTEDKFTRAIGTLLPVVRGSSQAVEQNNNVQALLGIWEDVYFKEGLSLALFKQTRLNHKSDLPGKLVNLYSRLVEYNNNSQAVDRKSLRDDLSAVAVLLEELIK